jgi:hypothetical protein
MAPPVDASAMLALVTPICGVGVALQSLEVWWNSREFSAGGLLGWPQPRAPAAGPVRRLAHRLYQPPGPQAILLARAGGALACLFLPYGSPAVCGLLAWLVVAQLYFNRRFTILRGNCDTLALVCLSAAFAGSIPGASPRLQAAALALVAFHAALAYSMNGYDKLTSALWRDGTRLGHILQDGKYRFPPLGDWPARHPRWVAAGAWSVILLELLFPLCVVLPPAGFWLFIAGGTIFHAAIAFMMGLHGFWWTFVSTYPAFYFFHSLRGQA